MNQAVADRNSGAAVALKRTEAKPIDEYLNLSEAELFERIQAAKKALGDRVVILGHHYQRDDVICHADLTGDSFKLSQMAAERHNAEFLVFCGVHFMAESADILSTAHQQVILPDMAAGCSMADMARLDQVEDAWEQLQQLGITDVLPITYMNSAANIKAFCGRHDGVVCTSSNALPLFKWAFAQREKLFFFPDEHLGRNTGIKFGIPLEQMVVWDPRLELGGNTPDQLRQARQIVEEAVQQLGPEFPRRFGPGTGSFRSPDALGKFNAITTPKLLAIFTDQQREQWQQLTGTRAPDSVLQSVHRAIQPTPRSRP